MTLQLGPLALPLGPLALLVILAATAWIAARASHPSDRMTVDGAIWWSAAAGLLGARLAYLLRHLEVYRDHPLAALDIRDGGFLVLPGIAIAMLVLLWLMRTKPASRVRVIGIAVLGLSLWWSTSAVLQERSPVNRINLASLGVPLLPVPLTPPTGSKADTNTDTDAVTASSLASIAARTQAQPMVVNLWATWCAPCRAEMPVFARAQASHPQITFIFANQGETQAVIQAYLQREGLALREIWLDPGSGLGRAVGSSALPTTLFFDVHGRLVKVHLGMLSEAALRVMLAPLSKP